MALKLRRTGLGSGLDKDRPDYTVYTGEWDVGRSYQTRGGPDSLRWFWSMRAEAFRINAQLGHLGFSPTWRLLSATSPNIDSHSPSAGQTSSPRFRHSSTRSPRNTTETISSRAR